MKSIEDLPIELKTYINKWKAQKGNLIMILHSFQDYYGYVPKESCFLLANELKIPLARIYEVLTFYNYFNLEPPVKYKISVCTGTACYLKGAADIINTVKHKLNIKDNKVSEDNKFKLENVRCFGCCGLSPVMSINGKIYGKLNNDKVVKIIDKYISEG